ncbi:MAG: hypothetical protein FJX20_20940 [Alphaproteobacteria bacterium]|nr:hypothetical protein [Alphaproteobacteria bacterium]
MRNWQPDIDLDRLLAALGEEIIDAPGEDIRTLCGQVGSPLSGIARDMRARIAAVVDCETEPAPAFGDIIFRRELSVRSH